MMHSKRVYRGGDTHRRGDGDRIIIITREEFFFFPRVNGNAVAAMILLVHIMLYTRTLIYLHRNARIYTREACTYIQLFIILVFFFYEWTTVCGGILRPARARECTRINIQSPRMCKGRRSNRKSRRCGVYHTRALLTRFLCGGQK
jgi:hypothetical protein